MKQLILRRILMKQPAILFLFSVLIFSSYQAQAESDETFTDRVYLKNGDRLTGSIKELDRGKLRLKTETMDTVYLHWVDVEAVESTTYMRIAVTDGSYRYGRMQKSAEEAKVRVFGAGDSVEVPMSIISSMKPLRVDQTILHQLEGEITAGVDYRQDTDILLINVGSKLRYRDEKYELEFGLNWAETQRSDGDNASRADLSGDYTRILEDRYFWKAIAALERNQEMGLDLRALAGGTAGRYFVQTPTMQFQANAGLVVSAEDRTDGKTTDSLEGAIRSSFDFFEFRTPMTRLSANLDIFPGITESGRVRINTNIKLRNEFVRDFFWDLTFYSTYDNQPADGADDSDYGVTTGLGATF